jgi:hypothetical protein
MINWSMPNQNNLPICAIISQFVQFLVEYVEQEGEVDEEEEEEDGEREFPTGREAYNGLAPPPVRLCCTSQS